jgi:hypothetical protein
MIEYINGWEWLPIVIFTIGGMIMMLFERKEGMTFFGILVLFTSVLLAHNTHHDNLDKAFVLKHFNEAHAITCAGGYRGDHTLIDPKSGWRWKENIGFIKGDQIHNDLGVCSVIGEESPSPSIVPYAFVLLFELMLGFALRGAMQKARTEEEGKNDEPGSK